MTDKWQPIETAPTDGTPVLVCAVYGSPCVSFWSSTYQEWEMVHINGWDPDARMIYEPTHWMPLPEPPKEVGEV